MKKNILLLAVLFIMSTGSFVSANSSALKSSSETSIGVASEKTSVHKSGVAKDSVAKNVESSNVGKYKGSAKRKAYPKTGDPSIDLQVQVLIDEMQKKLDDIEATKIPVTELYYKKIKAVVGDRPIINKNELRPKPKVVPVASNTVRHDAASGSVKGVSVDANGNQLLPEAQPVVPSMAATRSIQGGIGSQFNSLFRTIFGGDN